MVIFKIGFGDEPVAGFHFSSDLIGHFTLIKSIPAFIPYQFQRFGEVFLHQQVALFPTVLFQQIIFAGVQLDKLVATIIQIGGKFFCYREAVPRQVDRRLHQFAPF